MEHEPEHTWHEKEYLADLHALPWLRKVKRCTVCHDMTMELRPGEWSSPVSPHCRKGGTK